MDRVALVVNVQNLEEDSFNPFLVISFPREYFSLVVSEGEGEREREGGSEREGERGRGSKSMYYFYLPPLGLSN